jgi:hypothetical protein
VTLEPNQAHYRGLTFGDGTDVCWGEDVSGLRTLTVESNPVRLAQRDGWASSPHWVRPSPVTWSLIIKRGPSDSDADLEARVAAVEAVFAPSREVAHYLDHRFAGPERSVLVRVLRREVNMFPGWLRRRRVSMGIQFEKADPYTYGTTVHTLLVPTYQVLSGGGFIWPVTWPVGFGAPSGLEAVAVNSGNATAWPLIRVQVGADDAGTLTGFELLNTTTGETFQMVVTVGAGQTLVADMAAISRASPGPNIHIDGSSRSGGWQSPRKPWGLAPGSNTLRFSVSGTAADVRTTLTWRDTSY